jgi:hypothetical protein
MLRDVNDHRLLEEAGRCFGGTCRHILEASNQAKDCQEWPQTARMMSRPSGEGSKSDTVTHEFASGNFGSGEMIERIRVWGPL